MENQFIINAYGGVGIGTSATTKSEFVEGKYTALTVSSDLPYFGKYSDLIPPVDFPEGDTIANPVNIFKAVGREDSTDIMRVTSSGNMALGTTESVTGKLIVMDGRVGINTTNVLADLTVFLDEGSVTSDNAVIIFGNEDKLTSPSMVITTSGNIVSFGMYPDRSLQSAAAASSEGGFLQISSGNVVAEAFEFPDGERISTAPPEFYWSYFGTLSKDKVDAMPGVSWQGLIDNRYIDESGLIICKQIDIDNAATPVTRNLLQNPHIAGYRRSTPDIYFISGKAGIGASPNSVLELSNRGSSGLLDPLINFDFDDVNMYSLGLSKYAPGSLRFNNLSSPPSSRPQLTVSGNNTGISAANPLANLHVGGDAVIIGKLLITSNYSEDIDLENLSDIDVEGLKVNQFYVKGIKLSPGGTAWNPGDKKVYFNTFVKKDVYTYVGIGTGTPNYELEIAGTLNAQSDNLALKIKDLFKVENKLLIPDLILKDILDGSTSRLYVENKNLYLDGVVTNSVSSVFSRGELPDNQQGGTLVLINLETDDNVPELVETGLNWNHAAQKLSVTSNIDIKEQYQDIISIANNIDIGSDQLTTMLSVVNNITKDNNPYNSIDYTASNINVEIHQYNDVVTNERVTIKGLDIKLKQPDEASIVARGNVVGLTVDVGDVKLTEASDGYPGFRNAAVFMAKDFTGNNSMLTGNVGIGKFPEADLDVAGLVSANKFQIASTVFLTTINVNSSISIVTKNRIEVGVDSTDLDIEIGGNISANMVLANGLRGSTMEAQDGILYINNGRVGMGLTNPSAQLELKKDFSENTVDLHEFTFKNIILNLEYPDCDKDLTAFSVDIESSAPNAAGYGNYAGDQYRQDVVNITGIDVDFSKLTVESSVETGIEIIVTSDVDAVGDPANKQFAAIFKGGSVGIGVSNPGATDSLQVDGTISATNIPSVSLQGKQHTVSLKDLFVTGSPKCAIIDRTFEAQDIIVDTFDFYSESVNEYIDRLTLEGFLNLPARSLIIDNNGNVNGGDNTLYINYASVTSTFDAAEIFAYKGIYGLEDVRNTVSFNVLGVGTGIPAPESGYELYVEGGVSVNSVTVDRYVRLKNTSGSDPFVLNINNTLSLGLNRTAGFGTNSPANNYSGHVFAYPTPNTGNPAKYNPGNNETWNPVRIEVPSTAGITLIPAGIDQQITANQGVHIIAVEGPLAKKSSYLALYTDPAGYTQPLSESGKPVERMRIGSSGNVYIGTTSGTASFNVGGRAVFGAAGSDDEFISLMPLNINSITGNNGVNVYAQLNVLPSFNMYNLAVTRTLSIHPSKEKSLKPGYSNLFVEGSKLYFVTGIDGNTVSINITPDFMLPGVNDQNIFPHYSTENLALTKSSTLTLVTSNAGGQLFSRIGILHDELAESDPGDSVLELVSYIPEQGFTDTEFDSFAVNMNFEKRSLDTDSVFTGVAVDVSGNLGENMSGAGLVVNMDVLASTIHDNYDDVEGEKYAAVFMSSGDDNVNDPHGLTKTSYNICIVTSPDSSQRFVTPHAYFYVSSNVIGAKALLVSSDSQAMVIDYNGNTGLVDTASTVLPASLTVSKNNVDINFVDSSGTTMFSVNNNGVGINTSNPDSKLFVNDTVSGNNLYSKEFYADTLKINKGQKGLVVTDGGYIGIGRLESVNPEELIQLDFYKQITDVDDVDPLILQNGRVSILENVQHNITGMDIVISSDENNLLGFGESEPVVKGMDINISNFEVTKNGIVAGFAVSLTSNTLYLDSVVSYNAAVLMGGSVGIGMTDPEAVLDINGILKAEKFSQNGNEAAFNKLDLDRATINRQLFLLSDSLLGDLYIVSNNHMKYDIQVRDTLKIQGDFSSYVQYVPANLLMTANVINVDKDAGLSKMSAGIEDKSKT